MDAFFHIAVLLCSHNTDYMDSLHEPLNTLARIWWWPPEDGSLYDPKHVRVKEFYVILMCFLINMCMSWLLLTLILSMYGSTMKQYLVFIIWVSHRVNPSNSVSGIRCFVVRWADPKISKKHYAFTIKGQEIPTKFWELLTQWHCDIPQKTGILSIFSE